MPAPLSVPNLAPDAALGVASDAQVKAQHPVLQSTIGDAASTAAVRRLSHSLASGRGLKAQKKAIEKLKGAVAAIRVGDFDAGARRALDALDLAPDSGLAWHLLAICREKQGQFGEAIQAYEAALQRLPDETDVAQDLGRLAQRLGYLEIAEKLLIRYLAARPGDIEATNNLACVLRDASRYGDAVELLRPMLEIHADSAVLWNTLGSVMNDQGRLDEALIFFEEALRLEPDFAKARYNRANVRGPLGDVDGAIEDILAALPGAESAYERAMMNMALALTRMGQADLPDAFAAYEVRFDPALPDAMRVAVDAPRWTGDIGDIRDKHLLVVGEQGIADELIFGNCLRDVIDAVGPRGRVYIAVEARMVGLFQRAFPDAIVGGHKAVRLEGRLTRFIPFAEDVALDAWIPMGGLLAPFRPSIDRFPAAPRVIVPDPVRVAHWRSELAALGPERKIGLHWKSLVMTGARAAVFSSFERWRPILTTPGCLMVNLQCGDVSADLAEAEAAGIRIWTPPINLKDDLEDVAALSVACDLVIGPGIAGTNIAAAAGAPTWLVAAPDDWHLMSTDRYVFYPQTRVFVRGAVDGWPDAIDRMRAELDAALAQGWNID